MDHGVSSLVYDFMCYLCASGFMCVYPPPATWLFSFKKKSIKQSIVFRDWVGWRYS